MLLESSRGEGRPYPKDNLVDGNLIVAVHVAKEAGFARWSSAPSWGTSTDCATERYMHAVEPELWAVAQQLEAELGALPEEPAAAAIGGVKTGVSGVKNGVNLDAASCNQTTGPVGKSKSFRLERWPSGRRRTPAKRVWG